MGLSYNLSGRMRRTRTSPGRARPRPVFRLRHQCRLHRIPLDVTNDLIAFVPSANPSIERFVLPEALSGAFQQAVRAARARTLDHQHYLGQLLDRTKQRVYMVGHHDPRRERAEFPCSFRFDQRLHDAVCYARILHPVRTNATLPWQRAVKAPRHEKLGSIGLTVGKVPAVILHDR